MRIHPFARNTDTVAGSRYAMAKALTLSFVALSLYVSNSVHIQVVRGDGLCGSNSNSVVVMA